MTETLSQEIVIKDRQGVHVRPLFLARARLSEVNAIVTLQYRGRKALLHAPGEPISILGVSSEINAGFGAKINVTARGEDARIAIQIVESVFGSATPGYKAVASECFGGSHGPPARVFYREFGPPKPPAPPPQKPLQPPTLDDLVRGHLKRWGMMEEYDRMQAEKRGELK